MYVRKIGGYISIEFDSEIQNRMGNARAYMKKKGGLRITLELLRCQIKGRPTWMRMRTKNTS